MILRNNFPTWFAALKNFLTGLHPIFIIVNLNSGKCPEKTVMFLLLNGYSTGADWINFCFWRPVKFLDCEFAALGLTAVRLGFHIHQLYRSMLTGIFGTVPEIMLMGTSYAGRWSSRYSTFRWRIRRCSSNRKPCTLPDHFLVLSKSFSLPPRPTSFPSH